jgi:hypothetical protein
MALTVRIDVEARVEWWRPLVQWVLCIPHLLYEVVLSGASVVLALVMGLIVATTGHVPEKLAAFQTTTLRERVRCYAYLFVLRSSLPPYVSRVSGMDPGDDPLVEVSATPSPRASRWSGITRPIAVLPHVVVLVPIAIVMDLCYPLGMLVVGANRGWPEGFAKFLVRIEKWAGALLAYVFLISDDAPHFGLAAYDEDAYASGAHALA